MKLTYLLVGSAFALATSCSDSTSPTNTIGASGSLSFSYTGAGVSNAATYSASGAVPTNANVNFGTRSWAAGTQDNTSQEIDILAAIPKTSSTWDVATLAVAGLSAGTKTIDPTCSAAACTSVIIDFGATQNETNFQFICSLTSGSVVVTSVTASRVAGTFSGSGSCFSSSNASSPFTITNGTFDVALLSGVFL